MKFFLWQNPPRAYYTAGDLKFEKCLHASTEKSMPDLKDHFEAN